VTVEDPAPSGVFFRQAHPSQGHCTINRELRCALGTIPAGGQALVQVTATIAADASGPIVNHASVWGNQGDPNESNDTAASTVHVTPHLAGPGTQPVSDLVVTKHVDLRVARQGQRLRYTITVTNKGPDPATGVRLTDTPRLPVRILQIHTGQGHCQPGPPLTCTLGTLHPGAHVTITIIAVGTVAAEQTNTAAVLSHSRDPDPSSSVAAARTTITPLRRPPRPHPPAARYRLTEETLAGAPSARSSTSQGTTCRLPLSRRPSILTSVNAPAQTSPPSLPEPRAGALRK
jgi:uncharacterized repeat protein (TIGR01451 family)